MNNNREEPELPEGFGDDPISRALSSAADAGLLLIKPYKEKIADLERRLAAYEEESAALPEDRSIREVVQVMQKAQARFRELEKELNDVEAQVLILERDARIAIEALTGAVAKKALAGTGEEKSRPTTNWQKIAEGLSLEVVEWQKRWGDAKTFLEDYLRADKERFTPNLEYECRDRLAALLEGVCVHGQQFGHRTGKYPNDEPCFESHSPPKKETP